MSGAFLVISVVGLVRGWFWLGVRCDSVGRFPRIFICLGLCWCRCFHRQGFLMRCGWGRLYGAFSVDLLTKFIGETVGSNPAELVVLVSGVLPHVGGLSLGFSCVVVVPFVFWSSIGVYGKWWPLTRILAVCWVF